MKVLVFSVLAALALGAGAAHANDAEPGFHALDRDNDGYLTREEARLHAYLDRNFDRADANRDGQLNRAEYLTELARRPMRPRVVRAGGGAERNAGTGGTAQR